MSCWMSSPVRRPFCDRDDLGSQPPRGARYEPATNAAPIGSPAAGIGPAAGADRSEAEIGSFPTANRLTEMRPLK